MHSSVTASSSLRRSFCMPLAAAWASVGARCLCGADAGGGGGLVATPRCPSPAAGQVGRIAVLDGQRVGLRVEHPLVQGQ
uniref:Putative secreted protein n=1 Tax=Ixodes ricinus TaxID=34613 RepID=A0A6B0U5Q6_IXORI